MQRSKSNSPWEAPSMPLQVFCIGSLVTVYTSIEMTQWVGRRLRNAITEIFQDKARTFKGRSVVLPTVTRTIAQRTKNTMISGTRRCPRCTGHTLLMIAFRRSQEPPFHL